MLPRWYPRCISIKQLPSPFYPDVQLHVFSRMSLDGDQRAGLVLRPASSLWTFLLLLVCLGNIYNKMFDRNDVQSLTMRQAGHYHQQESSTGSRSSSGSDGTRRGQPHQIRSARQSSSGAVPAFTIRSAQPGNRVQPPKRINIFAERPTPSLAFRRIYQRGDLPVCIVHESRLYRLGWKVSCCCFFR